MTAFQTVAHEAISASQHVVFDMADVTFLDSSGLRVLVATALQVRKGGSVTIRNTPANVARVIELADLSDAVTVELPNAPLSADGAQAPSIDVTGIEALEQHACAHAIDLAHFYEALAVLRRMAGWEPDEPFANEVLLLLQLNYPLGVAIIEANAMAVAHLGHA